VTQLGHDLLTAADLPSYDVDCGRRVKDHMSTQVVRQIAQSRRPKPDKLLHTKMFLLYIRNILLLIYVTTLEGHLVKRSKAHTKNK